MLNFNRKHVVFWSVLLGMMAPVMASALPVVWYQIGSGPVNYLSDYKTGDGGLFEFDFAERTMDYAIQGNVLVQTDPFIAWGLSVVNNTSNPMTFTTGVLNTFFAPLTTSNWVYSSISGSVTDIDGDGVTVTPVNAKIQTSTLNVTQNMGVDVGDPYHVGPGFPGQSYDMPAQHVGPQHGPVGDWTSMELVAEFVLSARDIATLNGFASITPVPEPATLLLVGCGLLGIAVWKRRKLF